MTARGPLITLFTGLALLGTINEASAACRIRGYFNMVSAGPWPFYIITDANGCRNRSFVSGGQIMFRNLYIDQQPTNGRLTLAQGGRYTYLPRVGYKGPDTFRLELCGEYLGKDSCVILDYKVTVE